MRIAALALTFTFPVAAQDADRASGGASGSTMLFRVGLGASYTDNFYYQPSPSKVDVVGMSVKPSFAYARNAELSRAEFDLGANATAYSYGQDENFLDWHTGATVSRRLSKSLALNASARFRHGHDPFGTDRTEGSTSAAGKLDTWNNTTGGLQLSLGQGESPLTFQLKAGVSDRRYLQNRDHTRFLDRNTTRASASAFLRLGPKTAFIIDAGHIATAFDETRTGSTPRDGATDYGRLGLRWEATAKTSGDIRVGVAEHAFDDASRPSISRASWVATLDWSVTAIDRFRLTSAQSFEPSYLDAAGTIDTEHYQLSWSRAWKKRLNTRVTAAYSELAFAGTARVDERRRLGAAVSYRAFANTTVSWGVEYQDRDSTTNTREFDRAVATMNFVSDLN